MRSKCDAAIVALHKQLACVIAKLKENRAAVGEFVKLHQVNVGQGEVKLVAHVGARPSPHRRQRAVRHASGMARCMRPAAVRAHAEPRHISGWRQGRGPPQAHTADGALMLGVGVRCAAAVLRYSTDRGLARCSPLSADAGAWLAASCRQRADGRLNHCFPFPAKTCAL